MAVTRPSAGTTTAASITMVQAARRVVHGAERHPGRRGLRRDRRHVAVIRTEFELDQRDTVLELGCCSLVRSHRGRRLRCSRDHRRHSPAQKAYLGVGPYRDARSSSPGDRAALAATCSLGRRGRGAGGPVPAPAADARRDPRRRRLGVLARAARHPVRRAGVGGDRAPRAHRRPREHRVAPNRVARGEADGQRRGHALCGAPRTVARARARAG